MRKILTFWLVIKGTIIEGPYTISRTRERKMLNI